MLIEYLDVSLTADTFEEHVLLEVAQSDDASHLAHILQQARRLFLNNLGDPLPVVCFDLVEEQREKKKLHSVG